MKKIDWFTVTMIITGTIFIIFPLPCHGYGEYGIDGGSCRDLQFGKLVKTEGGRPGTVIDCREQDNIVNTEAYAIVKFDDDPEHPKEVHWKKFIGLD